MANETEVITLIGKLGEGELRVLLELLRFLRERGNKSGFSASNKNAKNVKIKPSELGVGAVKQKALMAEARTKNHSISAQDGITKDDIKVISRKAREYGIPVAFTGQNDKDNIKVSFRESDKTLFSQIMTDIVKEKIADKPNEYTSFKLNKQNANIFRKMLNENDLANNFVVDKEGKIHCIHAVADKKAFEIVKNEFKKSYDEVTNDFMIGNTKITPANETEANSEYIVLRDNNKVISFLKDEIPSQKELTTKLRSEFGYDVTKAELAANKFADTLDAAQQKQFLEDNPLKLVNGFEQHIRLNNENILVQPFDFYRVNLKENNIDCYVVMNTDGQAASLIPEQMTDKQMRGLLTARLGITDKATLDAVVDKTNKISNIYKRDNANQKHGEFEISRNKNNVQFKHFEVKKGDNIQIYPINDNKGAVEDLQKDFGIDGKTAQAIYNKANKLPEEHEIVTVKREVREQPENPKTEAVQQEKEFVIERRADTFTVKAGEQSKEYPLNHNDDNLEQIKKDWNVDGKVAENIAVSAENQSEPQLDMQSDFAVARRVGGTFTVKSDNQTKEYPLNHSDENLDQIKNDWNIDDEVAEQIVSSAEMQSAVENEIARQSEQPENIRMSHGQSDIDYGVPPPLSDYDVPPLPDESYGSYGMGR